MYMKKCILKTPNIWVIFNKMCLTKYNCFVLEDVYTYENGIDTVLVICKLFYIVLIA